MAKTRLDTLLESHACGALLVVAVSGRDPFLAPFIGTARLHQSFLVAGRNAPPRLGYFTPMEREEAARSGLALLTPEALDIARWSREGEPPDAVLANVLSRGLQLAEVASGPVALAGHLSAGCMVAASRRLEAEGWHLVPGEAIVQRISKRKTSLHLSEIRRVAAGTMMAMRRTAEMLAGSTPASDGELGDGEKGSTGAELWFEGEALRIGRLRREIGRVFADLGLEQPHGNIVAPAEEGAVPHSAGDDQRCLRVGESLVVDLFPREYLFADCTRTFCVGQPGPELRRAHSLVLKALKQAHQSAKPGVFGWDLQQQTCAFFEQEGYPTVISDPGTTRGYVHGLGHGVGFELHELPNFRQEVEGQKGILEEGDVITLEPGLYDVDAGYGVRLEDLCWVTTDGVENLTPLPYDLDPRAWINSK